MHLWHRGNWIHWWMKPWGKHKTMHLWQMESELTAEWNPEEITKTCTSDTWASVLTGEETLRKPVNGAPLKDRKGHSQENETTMKPQNHAPLTHGKVNSLVNETQKKPEKHAPVKHGKVQSLLNETLMKPLTWLHQWTTHVWHTKQLIPWWMKPYRNQ